MDLNNVSLTAVSPELITPLIAHPGIASVPIFTALMTAYTEGRMNCIPLCKSEAKTKLVFSLPESAQ